MLADPQTVHSEDTVPKAVKLMLDYGMRNLPVVDDEGVFLGSFQSLHLLELLLPKAATIEGGLTDLTFVHDELPDIKDRLDDVRSHTVGDYMDTENLPVAYRDTSLIEAMLLLYQHRTHVPVVERDSRKLVGVVSFNTVLQAITGEK